MLYSIECKTQSGRKIAKRVSKGQVALGYPQQSMELGYPRRVLEVYPICNRKSSEVSARG